MKIQTGTMKLMTWFLVGALLALTAVGCESDSPDQTMPGEQVQVPSKEGLGSTPESIPQVRLTPLKETAKPSVDSTPEITLQVTPILGEETSEPGVDSTPEPIPQVSPTPGEETMGQEATSTPEPTLQASSATEEEILGECGKGRRKRHFLVSSMAKEEDMTTGRRRTREEIQAAVERAKPKVERARAIRHKYEDLFWRQPNVWGVGIGRGLYPNEEVSEGIGFVISVTKKVDQNTLPPEDRIPDCLEGVPVFIVEGSPPVLTPEAPEKPKEEGLNGGR